MKRFPTQTLIISAITGFVSDATCVLKPTLVKTRSARWRHVCLCNAWESSVRDRYWPLIVSSPCPLNGVVPLLKRLCLFCTYHQQCDLQDPEDEPRMRVSQVTQGARSEFK